MTKPVIIGLTGSIGCGKSTIMATLVALGAEGIDADRVGHEVMEPGAPAYGAVLAEFGADLAPAGGPIDRRLLGQRVFADPAALARLEAIIHPAVGEAVRARVARSTAPLVAIEAIKLFEAGLSITLCDEVWVADCPPDIQVARLAATRGMPAEEVARRRASQMPAADMRARADRVIDTGGTLAHTRMQTLAAWLALGLPLPEVTIRPATLDDAEGMAELIGIIICEGGKTVLNHPFTPDEERAYLAGMTPRERITVGEVGAEPGGVLVGLQSLDRYAAYTTAMDHVGVMGTFVLPALRGRGLGRRLTAATLAHARAVGFQKFVITVRADNPQAQNFYVHLGFRPCGRLARQAFIDDHYVDELLFELFLDDGGVHESAPQVVD